MIYFENDYFDYHGKVICDLCKTLISNESTTKKKWVDWKPHAKKICLECARANVDDKEDFDIKIMLVPQNGKKKYDYYDGKLTT